MEKRLDQLWVGSYKIRANCTRFHRNMEGQPEKHELHKGVVVKRKLAWNQTGKGTSFADVVKGGKEKKVWQKKKIDSEVWRGLDFTVKEDDMTWLGLTIAM